MAKNVNKLSASKTAEFCASAIHRFGCVRFGVRLTAQD